MEKYECEQCGNMDFFITCDDFVVCTECGYELLLSDVKKTMGGEK